MCEWRHTQTGTFLPSSLMMTEVRDQYALNCFSKHAWFKFQLNMSCSGSPYFVFFFIGFILIYSVNTGLKGGYSIVHLSCIYFTMHELIKDIIGGNKSDLHPGLPGYLYKRNSTASSQLMKSQSPHLDETVWQLLLLMPLVLKLLQVATTKSAPVRRVVLFWSHWTFSWVELTKSQV